MNITLDPSLEAAATRFTDELNAKRPKDAGGEFIDPPQTVEEVVTANLNAVVQSWKTAQDDADAVALKSLAPIYNAAPPEKQQQALAILQS